MFSHCASIAAFLVVFLSQVAAQTDECHHDYFYVNAGDYYAPNDIQVGIVCLDSTGCDSVVYVQVGCQGCFDPSCIDGVNKSSNSISFGSVLVINDTDFTSTLGISDGDLICSTGQLAVASRPSVSTEEQAHWWIPASLAGTKFVFLNYRGGLSDAGVVDFAIYAFEESTVTIIELGVALAPITIGAFSINVTTTALSSGEQPIRINATAPILVATSTSFNNRDYSLVFPAISSRMYGYDSQHVRGDIFNCITLASTIGSNTPTCEDSNGDSVTATPSGNLLFFEINDNQDTFYQGEAMVCTPPSGDCIALYTHGDLDGGGGTGWTHADFMSSFFAVPFTSNRLAISSAGSAIVTCTVRDETGVFLRDVQTSGTSTLVKDAYDDNVLTQGSTVNCTGNVAITAQFNGDEYNLLGLMDESLWDYSRSIFTCAPTDSPTDSPSTSPTTNPTDSPTASPTTSPTTFPTESPSLSPTTNPTGSPSESPTRAPTTSPTASPSTSPTFSPTPNPTDSPTTSLPSTSPTLEPSQSPSTSPTLDPTSTPVTTSPTSPPAGEDLIGIVTLGASLGAGLLGLLAIIIVISRRRRRNARTQAERNIMPKSEGNENQDAAHGKPPPNALFGLSGQGSERSNFEHDMKSL